MKIILWSSDLISQLDIPQSAKDFLQETGFPEEIPTLALRFGVIHDLDDCIIGEYAGCPIVVERNGIVNAYIDLDSPMLIASSVNTLDAMIRVFCNALDQDKVSWESVGKCLEEIDTQAFDNCDLWKNIVVEMELWFSE